MYIYLLKRLHSPSYSMQYVVCSILRYRKHPYLITPPLEEAVLAILTIRRRNRQTRCSTDAALHGSQIERERERERERWMDGQTDRQIDERIQHSKAMSASTFYILHFENCVSSQRSLIPYHIISYHIISFHFTSFHFQFRPRKREIKRHAQLKFQYPFPSHPTSSYLQKQSSIQPTILYSRTIHFPLDTQQFHITPLRQE